MPTITTMPIQPNKRDSHPQHSSELLRTYKRAVLWRKTMLICFSLIFIAVVFWAIPWLPYGLSVEDYDSRTLLLVGLMVMASLTAFGAVYHRDLSRRIEQTLVTWSSVHDGLGDLRKREYFYDRIVIECDRAAGSGSQFTVVTMRLENTDHDEKKAAQLSEQALAILAPTAKESDCLAILGPREIGMLAPDVDAKQALAFSQRLRSLVIEGMPDTTTMCASAGRFTPSTPVRPAPWSAMLASGFRARTAPCKPTTQRLPEPRSTRPPQQTARRLFIRRPHPICRALTSTPRQSTEQS